MAVGIWGEASEDRLEGQFCGHRQSQNWAAYFGRRKRHPTLALARETIPKQFLPFDRGADPLSRGTVRVNSALFCQPIVIVNEAFRFFAERQARDINVPVTMLLCRQEVTEDFVKQARPDEIFLSAAPVGERTPC